MKDKNNRSDITELYYFPDALGRRLAGILRRPLTIVEAPSGFGKTTAVREYLRGNLPPTSPVYWYTCLGETPLQAWHGISGLFARVDPAAGAALQKLDLPTADALADVASLLRGIRCTEKTCLVIDNYQLVSSEIPHRLIRAFSVHGNPLLHIVFITQQLRGDPEDTVHHDNIHHIGMDDLMFDRDSIARYFRLAGVTLRDSELDAVWDNTEGWVSAIRLQLLHYQQTGAFERTSDIEQLVKTAVWNKLSDAEKDFLLSVSVLDSFTTKQAQIMWDVSALPDDILHLLGHNGFIRYFPEHDRYVMHSILQDFLRSRFYNHQPRSYQERILRRAALACAAIHEYYPAALFYLQIGDYDAILSLPFDGVYLNNQKEKRILEFIVDVVTGCDDDTLCRYPLNVVGFAFHLYLGGQRELFAKLCGLIAHIIEHPGALDEAALNRIRGEYALLTSFSAYNDIRKMSEGHREANRYLDSPSLFLNPSSPWTFMNVSLMGHYWSRSGELDAELGHMDECMPYYSKLARGHGTGADTVMRAEALLMRGLDADAEALCHKAIYQARSQGQIGLCLCAELALARVVLLRGDEQAYRVALDSLRGYAAQSPDRFVLRMAELCTATLSLTLGDTEGLAEWLYDPNSIAQVLYVPAVPYGHMLYVQMLLLQKRYRELYGVVEPMLGMAQAMHYLLPQVYHFMALARAKYAQGQMDEAAGYLHRALDLSLPDGVLLPIAEGAADIVPLLEQAKLTHDSAQIDAIIALTKRQQDGGRRVSRALLASRSPLTPREREIALLARERRSARDIADTLFISESTVRSALKAIYRKLDIHAKRQLADIEF